MELYDEQTILFAMFILKANHYSWKWLSESFEDDSQWITRASLFYADLFSDRGIAEEEFEGWCRGWTVENFTSESRGSGYIEKNKSIYAKTKIKFRFVEE